MARAGESEAYGWRTHSCHARCAEVALKGSCECDIHTQNGRFGAFYVIPSCIWSDPAGIATPLCKRCMCGLRTVPSDNPSASYCGLQLVFTPLFTPPSGPPWKAHKGTFGLSRHPNELLVNNRCSCRYRHQYTRSATTRFGYSRNFFFFFF